MSSAVEKRSNPEVRLLGVRVHRLTWRRLIDTVAEAVKKDRRWIIANHNLHSVYLHHHDAAVRAFYGRADIVHIDGMSLVLFGKLLGLRLSRENRLTPLDWARPLMAEAARRGWRIFYLGSAPGIAARGADILRREFPGLLLDVADGYFDAREDGAENQNVVAGINRYRPHLLLVGMGMPRQERWVLENAARVQTNAIFNVGALMDYIAGAAPTPPRWLGPLGLEWLFRLLCQPARLWRRYLLEPWFVCGLFLAELAARVRR
jgi:N-acetylglucosaminyldiphosphoundecaprenol N-acetyl-beta-D-mannosaminyltransferase